MRAKEFLSEFKIRKVTRERVDGSIEVKWEVLDDNGVTRAIRNDKESALSWARTYL